LKTGIFHSRDYSYPSQLNREDSGREQARYIREQKKGREFLDEEGVGVSNSLGRKKGNRRRDFGGIIPLGRIKEKG